MKKLTYKKLRNLMGKKLAFGSFDAVKGEKKDTLVIDGVVYVPSRKAMYFLGCFEDAKNKGYDDNRAFLIAFFSGEYTYLKY